MKMSRRVFFSALLFRRPTQTKSLEVAVIETFGTDGRTTAVLAHHADSLSRDRLADWLRSHPKSFDKIRSNAGEETTATVFRPDVFRTRINSSERITEYSRKRYFENIDLRRA
jgi:hypothetical protein